MIRFYYTIKGLLNIILRSDYFSKRKIETPGKGRVLRILGNGKSLNNVNLGNNDKIDYMVVNRHVLAENYKSLKPLYYVLADPHFFNHEEGISVMHKICEQTNWNMTMFVPFTRRSCFYRKIDCKNPKISIKTYNFLSFLGYERIAYALYDLQLAMPVVQNVIVAAIMLGLQMKYDAIELYGVEHNWLNNLYVGEDNLVYLRNEHFYDKKEVNPKPQKEIQHLDEYPLYLNITHYARMFQSYWEIKKYVSHKTIHTRIVNKTKNSFIDAFERE